MVKIPGKSAARTPVTVKTAPAKPTKGGVKGISIPPAVKTEIRRIIREEVAKATKPGR